MTTYNMVNALSSASTGEQPRELENGAPAESVWTFALSVALSGGDLIQGQTMPAGNYLTDVAIDSDDLDTGGTPAIAFDVCLVGATGTIFIKNSTVAQSGGVDALGGSTSQPASIGYTATVASQFQIKVRTGPQVGASSGTIRLRTRWTKAP